MSNERDIIIKRLEQKLEERDKQIAKIRDSLKESVLEEINKRFEEMNKSIRDSLSGNVKGKEDAIHNTENRMVRIERRLVELNSSYDGVMKELLDQKAIIKEIVSTKKEKKPEVREEKASEPSGKKGDYIIAENYSTKHGTKQAVIEADEDIPETHNDKEIAKPISKSKPAINKIENKKEGVEITETLKKR